MDAEFRMKTAPNEKRSPAYRAWRQWIPLVLIYGFAMAMTLGIVVHAMRLCQADWNIPFGYSYRNDATWSAMLVKGIVDHGWFIHNANLGAPWQLFHEDFPLPETLNFLIMRLLAVGTPSAGRVLNIFFLLTFPLTTASALYVFRRFGISAVVGIPISILYALLPAHFFRGEQHFMLAAYYLVPLWILLCVWVAGRVQLVKRDSVLALVVCVLVGAAGVYYAFFGCFLMGIAAVMAAARERSVRAIYFPALLLSVVVASQALNLTPSLLYSLQNGRNATAVSRSPYEADTYGLRITQLLLPVTSHRVPVLSRLKAAYNRFLGHSYNESDFATLGIAGTCGFLILICALFWSGAAKRGSLIGDLALLNAGAVLLGTTSGFGPLAGLLFLDGIRAYNRISVFVAYFALFALALAAETVRERMSSGVGKRVLFAAAMGGALLLGAGDQISPAFTPDHEKQKAEFAQDGELVERIERMMPRGAMIYELPYVPFPETPPIYRMNAYDLFLPYLHSRDLRWSFGAMKGRPEDAWEERISGEQPAELVDTLSLAGFSGIYIDRDGYADEGHALEAQLGQVLNEASIPDTRGKAAFFDLRPHAAALRAGIRAEDWPRRVDGALYPMLLTWGPGFYFREGSTEDNWRWSAAESSIEISNWSHSAKTVAIRMTLQAGFPEPSTAVEVEGPEFKQTVALTGRVVPFTASFRAPYGHSQIRFFFHGQVLKASEDPRALFFRVNNFKLSEAVE